MKRYRHHPKPAKLSKNQIRRRLHQALQAIEPISREKANLTLELSTTRSRLWRSEEERTRLTQKFDKLTETVWQHARVYPGEPVNKHDAMPCAQFTGCVQIAVGVDLNGVRMMTPKNSEAWIEAMAQRFAQEAHDRFMEQIRFVSA